MSEIDYQSKHSGKKIDDNIDLVDVLSLQMKHKADMMKMSDRLRGEDITANKGFLIKTDIPFEYGKSFFIEIKGNSYATGIPINTLLQGYIYNNTIYTSKAINLGENISSINIFNLNNKICLWLKLELYFTGIQVSVINDGEYETGGSFTNLVTSITIEPKPTNITQEVICVPKQVATTDKIDNLFEKGTWTPTLNFGGSAGTTTYSIQRATYVRNNKLVYCQFVLRFTNVNGTGNMRISSLPFTPNRIENVGIISQIIKQSTSLGIGSLVNGYGYTIFDIIKQNGANLIGTDINDGSEITIFGSMQYEIA